MANSSYYPHGGPAEFSYTEDFKDKFQTTGKKAYLNVSLQGHFGANVNLSNGIKALENLKMQYERARQAENRFIAEHQLLIDGQRTSNGSWSDIIRAINEFYSTREVFERNIQLLKQRDETGGAYNNALRFLPTYIEKAAEEIFANRKWIRMRPDTLMNKLLKRGLELMVEQTDSIMEDGIIKLGRKRAKNPKGEALQAYKSMEYLVNILGNSKSPFSKILSKSLGLSKYTQELQQTFANGTSDTIKVPKMSVSTTGTGTIAEMASAASIQYFMDELSSVLGIGTKGFKTDVLTHNLGATGNMIFNSMKGASNDESKRVHAIEEYERAYKELAKLFLDADGEIVQISNKNYIINADFKNKYHGFTAQGETTLRNFQAFMSSLPHIGLDIDELIDYLANVGEYSGGESMIISNADSDILSGIATQIAYFLFDDIDIKLPNNISNINRVYLMELSGIYVPLSIILEGVYNSLVKTADSVTAEVQASTSVEIVGNGNVAEEKWTDRSVFERFRQGRIDKTTISFHFLSNFTEFITKAMTINTI